MIARQAGGGSGGARSADTVAQSAAGRRVASTIDFLHTTVREVRKHHVPVFSPRLFPRAEYFQAICLAFKAAFVCVRVYAAMYSLRLCFDQLFRSYAMLSVIRRLVREENESFSRFYGVGRVLRISNAITLLIPRLWCG